VSVAVIEGHIVLIFTVNWHDEHLNSTIMEEDRAHVDLGIAADLEEGLEEAESQRQPKKRFVGRRQAAEAASKNNGSGSVEDSGVIQGEHLVLNTSRISIDKYQSQNLVGLRELSTKYPQRFSTTPISMLQLPFSLQTITLRYIKLFTEYEQMARRRSPCRCQKAFYSLRPQSPIYSLSFALGLRL